MAGRPVVDKTGLAGYYELTLPDVGGPINDSVASSARDDESIGTVLPEAFGLRLEPAKGLAEKLVI